jgi:hypothetical protein
MDPPGITGVVLSCPHLLIRPPILSNAERRLKARSGFEPHFHAVPDADLEAHGHDARNAWELLDRFRHTQRLHETDRDHYAEVLAHRVS